VGFIKFETWVPVMVALVAAIGVYIQVRADDKKRSAEANSILVSTAMGMVNDLRSQVDELEREVKDLRARLHEKEDEAFQLRREVEELKKTVNGNNGA
jgi:uncharacterized protein involved in exopolysaccharide biosynthesis